MSTLSLLYFFELLGLPISSSGDLYITMGFQIIWSTLIRSIPLTPNGSSKLRIEIRSEMFNADLVLNGYAELSTYTSDDNNVNTLLNLP